MGMRILTNSTLNLYRSFISVNGFSSSVGQRLKEVDELNVSIVKMEKQFLSTKEKRKKVQETLEMIQQSGDLNASHGKRKCLEGQLDKLLKEEQEYLTGLTNYWLTGR